MVPVERSFSSCFHLTVKFHTFRCRSKILPYKIASYFHAAPDYYSATRQKEANKKIPWFNKVFGSKRKICLCPNIPDSVLLHCMLSVKQDAQQQFQKSKEQHTLERTRTNTHRLPLLRDVCPPIQLRLTLFYGKQSSRRTQQHATDRLCLRKVSWGWSCLATSSANAKTGRNERFRRRGRPLQRNAFINDWSRRAIEYGTWTNFNNARITHLC